MNLILIASIAFGYLISLAEGDIQLPCTTTEECLPIIENSVCNTTTQECECPDSTVLSSSLDVCLPIAEGPDAECQDSTQCSAILSFGGVCSDGKCACEEGYHYLKGVCWKNVGLGGTCSKSEQCFASYEYIGLECINSKCKCKDGFFERFGSACRRKMSETDVCFIDADCWCDDQQTGKCTDSKCQCPGSKNEPSILLEADDIQVEEISPKETCPPGSFLTGGACKLELGMECSEETAPCGAPRSTCYESACACVQVSTDGRRTSNSVANAVNRKCIIPLSTIPSDKTCEENGMCAVFGDKAICEDGQCKCIDSSHWIEGDRFCFETKNLGEDCSTEKDCYASSGPTVCDAETNKCKCKEGYHERSNDCFKDAFHVDEECHANEDCMFDNSRCDNNKCACAEAYFESEGLCIQGLHSSCTDDSECDHVEHATCNTTSGICECYEDFVSSENERFCLPVAEYEGKCSETVQCNDILGELKECKNGICTCSETAHFSNGKCYETKQLGEKCLNKNECVYGQDPNAVFCLNGRCACQFDYVKTSNNKCVKDGSDDSDKDNSGNNQRLSILLITSSSFLLLFKNI